MGLKGNGWAEHFLDITPAQGISPGERWQEALKKAADRCEVVLFLISPKWRDSKWCLAEFLLAKQLGKRIFGVLIEPTSLDSLPKEMTTEWQLANLIDGNKRTFITVQHDPLVPEVTVSFADSGLVLLKQGLQKAGLDPTHFDWPPKHDPHRASYRGLKALEADDAAIFFGRGAAIVRGLDKLRLIRDEGVERLFVILGASGAGKSSYLRAGLWPRLARDDRHFLPLPVIRPENHVITGPTGLMAALETTFEKLGEKKSRGDLQQILGNPGGFDQLLIELQQLAQTKLVDGAEPPTIILSIDQGEELFGADGQKEAERFLSLLGSTLSPPAGDLKNTQAARRRIIGIIAIRSDSYDRLQTAPTLAAVKHNPFNLKPIAREDFQTVIDGPANVITARGQKLTIDPKLAEQLLADTTGADALPLLAFTLERLYLDYGKDGDLLLDEYEKLGGVRGSIEAAVTTALANPDHPPAIPRDPAVRDEHLRHTFIPWLAGIDPETGLSKRRVASREELREKLPKEAQPLIERLVQARLLTQDQRSFDANQGVTTIIEVAHEALLRQWPTLTKWIDQDAEQLRIMEMVRRDAAEWDKKGRGDEWLDLRGERLKTTEALRQRPDLWRQLNQQAQDYIIACRTKDDQVRVEREAQIRRIEEEQQKVAEAQSRIREEQKRVDVAQKETALSQKRNKVLLTWVAVIILMAGGWILFQTRDLAHQTSLVLATASQIAGDTDHFDRALRFAILAARDTWLSPTSVEAEPQLARAAQASTSKVRFAHKDVRSAAFTTDGTKVVSVSSDNRARIWDVATGKELAHFIHIAQVKSAAFIIDSVKVVTVSDDNRARIWDVATGKELVRFPHEAPINQATLSPERTKILTASDDYTARLWDVATGKELAHFIHTAQVKSAAFIIDGAKVVTVSSDNRARIWDIGTENELAHFTYQGDANSAILTADGTRILTTSKDKDMAQVWDVTTGKELARFTHADHIWSATFSPDGTKVATTSRDKTARIWDVATGKELARFTHESNVYSATFTTDNTKILTTSNDKALVWNMATRKELARFTHEKAVWSAAFTIDGAKVVTASSDQTARVWDAATGKELARFIHEDSIKSAAFTTDGTKVVTVSDNDTAQVWDIAREKKLAHFLHGLSVNSTTFTTDGTKVVTASRDKTARVWDVATGKELARFTHESAVESATFSPDSTKVLTASDDKTARLWDIHWLTQYHGQELIERACREKLIGARQITKGDIGISPLLSRHAEGEDVCDPPSWFSRLLKSVGFGSKPVSNSD